MSRALAVAANGVGVTTGEANGERILREAVALDPDVILVGMAEADDVSVLDGRFLPDDWNVIHRGKDLEKDGSLLAYDKTRVKVLSRPRWSLGVTNDLPGQPPARMQPRWFITVDAMLDYDTKSARRREVTVGHFPPPDCPPVYWQRMATAARIIDPDLLLADFNADRARLRKVFPGHSIRVPEGDVMGAVVKKQNGLHVARPARSVRIPGSDHNGTLIHV